MFNKMNKLGSVLIVVFALILLFSMPVEATDTTRLGNTNSSGLYRMTIDHEGIVTFQADTGIKFPYQSGTTNDTLTAADSGRTYVTTAGTTSFVILNLPAATPGLNFPVITGTTHSVYLNPSGTEIINYASLLAGDAIYNSSAAKGDSIVLFCVTAGQWEADIHNGTWANGGGFGF